jgi:Family of unknown function (DUF5681)
MSMPKKTNDVSAEDTAAVGYGNPPKSTRFKPGQSGNSRGRPKGSLNMATVLTRILREKVIINENGRRKTVSKLEAAVAQVINKAASGDLKAVALLAGLVRFEAERAIDKVQSIPVLNEMDDKVMVGILKRLEPTKEEIKNEESIGSK